MFLNTPLFEGQIESCAVSTWWKAKCLIGTETVLVKLKDHMVTKGKFYSKKYVYGYS